MTDTIQPLGFGWISLWFQAGLKFLHSSGSAAPELRALASTPSLLTILFPLWTKKYNEHFGETMPIL